MRSCFVINNANVSDIYKEQDATGVSSSQPQVWKLGRGAHAGAVGANGGDGPREAQARLHVHVLGIANHQ